ncbi:hypothetical protein D5086_016524 [Populus alba]|uniref:Uncharacterized protein n=1 Tax=Populus alba TaxID=43335 RepID=A0ACC4BUE4_POPAL
MLSSPLHSSPLQTIKSSLSASSTEMRDRRRLPHTAPFTSLHTAVQNAIEYLKIIGALDQNENLTVLGRHLTILPLEPKLGKMLILGAILNCLDPVLTVVAGLSVRDHFLMPLDKIDLAEAAKSQFSSNYSDQLVLVRAYEGWKDAARDLSGYDLVDGNPTTCNSCSHDEHLVRAVPCYGLYPGICSIMHNEKSFSLKTMEDGQVLMHSDGHLKMLGGYLEFFMQPAVPEMYQSLRRQLDEVIQTKLLNPRMDIHMHHELLSAVRQLQTLLTNAGYAAPSYKTKQSKNNQFRGSVEFNVTQIMGQPCQNKKSAEKDAAVADVWDQTSQEYQSHVNVAEEEQKGSLLESIVKLPIDCFFGEPLAELLVPSNSGTQGNVVFLLWDLSLEMTIGYTAHLGFKAKPAETIVREVLYLGSGLHVRDWGGNWKSESGSKEVLLSGIASSSQIVLVTTT